MTIHFLLSVDSEPVSTVETLSCRLLFTLSQYLYIVRKLVEGSVERKESCPCLKIAKLPKFYFQVVNLILWTVVSVHGIATHHKIEVFFLKIFS
jgi:hypothetical protein